MIKCNVAIGVDIDDYTEWYIKEFLFSVPPRIGETIWIGDHLEFVIEGVEYGFLDDGPPDIRVVVSMSYERFSESWGFLEEWGFSGKY